MNKKIIAPALLAISLLFLGAGCDKAAEVKEAEKTFNAKEAQNQIPEEKSEKTSGLNLTAEALGDGMVKFVWEKSDDVATDKERGFVLVRSENANPENDGTNFWFRQSADKRETVWKDVPAGKLHFRICALREEKCAVYSNDVELEVK